MASTCANKYEYYIYGALGLLLIASEALGITKSIKPNSLLDVAGFIGKLLSNETTKRINSIRSGRMTASPEPQPTTQASQVEPHPNTVPQIPPSPPLPSSRTASVTRDKTLFNPDSANELGV